MKPATPMLRLKTQFEDNADVVRANTFMNLQYEFICQPCLKDFIVITHRFKLLPQVTICCGPILKGSHYSYYTKKVMEVVVSFQEQQQPPMNKEHICFSFQIDFAIKKFRF